MKCNKVFIRLLKVDGQLAERFKFFVCVSTLKFLVAALGVKAGFISIAST